MMIKFIGQQKKTNVNEQSTSPTTSYSSASMVTEIQNFDPMQTASSSSNGGTSRIRKTAEELDPTRSSKRRYLEDTVSGVASQSSSSDISSISNVCGDRGETETNDSAQENLPYPKSSSFSMANGSEILTFGGMQMGASVQWRDLCQALQKIFKTN